MKNLMRHHLPIVTVTVLFTFGLLVPGCGSGPDLLAPENPAIVDSHPLPPAGPARDGIVAGSVDVATEAWSLVATELVEPGHSTKVKGSRYELRFKNGSVAEPTVITIHEYDPLLADVEFGPDGSQFGVPVDVTIDYRGTALDPSSRNYQGLPLQVFWYNPATGGWEPIPFDADRKLKKVRFSVTHFSRYGLTDAVTESEWQWGRHGR